MRRTWPASASASTSQRGNGHLYRNSARIVDVADFISSGEDSAQMRGEPAMIKVEVAMLVASIAWSTVR